RFIVPRDSGAAERGLAVFLPAHKRSALKWYQWWLRIGNGARPGYFRETGLLQEMKSFLGLQPLRTLLSVGAPGPYSKNTLVFVNGRGAVGPIIKVGVSPAAVALLQNEAKWLASLGDKPALASHIPQLLWSGEWRGFFLLVQSCMEGKRVGTRFASSFGRFLTCLQTAETRRQGFIGSKMHRDMRRRYAELRPLLSPAWIDIIERSLARLESAFADTDVVMVVAHRDFAHWNLRQGSQGLVVFDWEYASEEYLPQYDYYHFHFHPLACRREWEDSDLKSALALARRTTTALHSMAGMPPYVTLLAYLLDLSLTYLKSTSGEDKGAPVIRNYYKLIGALERDCYRKGL
ncbi:MAG: phosphotransferase, partial [Candidatus Brocadiales bacterium]|nr:phosphotransferase [Candidatus Bathyanammoxibius sp.]